MQFRENSVTRGQCAPGSSISTTNAIIWESFHNFPPLAQLWRSPVCDLSVQQRQATELLINPSSNSHAKESKSSFPVKITDPTSQKSSSQNKGSNNYSQFSFLFFFFFLFNIITHSTALRLRIKT